MTDYYSSPIDSLHRELGARMVPFAGWLMPLQYPAGIIREHIHCREQASFFDVSHMLQLEIFGGQCAQSLEQFVVGDILGLDSERTRYTLMVNTSGGVVDDLMVTNLEDRFFLVANASRRMADLDYLKKHLHPECRLCPRNDQALFAIQGPAAKVVVRDLGVEVADFAFLESRRAALAGIECRLWRLGYTGEDGFEISVPTEDAENLARMLLEHDAVEPAGLGSRNTLRLEAGLCLYGHELDETTTPVEANLVWTIGRRRRQTLDFAGAQTIVDQLENGSSRALVGLRPHGNAPARDGTIVMNSSGLVVGQVTSGGYGPSISTPIALAYVGTDYTTPGTKLGLQIRTRVVQCDVVPIPFVPHRYNR
ncbi:MAG: glycine cleavage system aminomethyltransferase GcvT [Pseudomonadota bacterium]